MVTRFFIYGIAGWALEIFWTGLGSFSKGNWELAGFTYLWMFPIYGLAVFFEPLHERIRYYPWYFRGAVWSVLILAVEYSSGWFLELLIGNCPWDYSRETPYHVQGYIRLDYAPLWFLVGLLFERFHLFLDKNRV